MMMMMIIIHFFLLDVGEGGRRVLMTPTSRIFPSSSAPASESIPVSSAPATPFEPRSIAKIIIYYKGVHYYITLTRRIIRSSSYHFGESKEILDVIKLQEIRLASSDTTRKRSPATILFPPFFSSSLLLLDSTHGSN
jgi:hypothetical protein